jgi:hypothetical protein
MWVGGLCLRAKLKRFRKTGWRSLSAPPLGGIKLISDTLQGDAFYDLLFLAAATMLFTHCSTLRPPTR